MSSSSSTIPWAVGAPRRMHSEEQSSCAGLLRGTCRDTRRVATDPSSRWLPVSLGEQELHLLQRACLEARRLVDPAPNRNPSGSCGSPLDSACQVGADKISFPPPLVEQSDPPSLPGVTRLATDLRTRPPRALEKPQHRRRVRVEHLRPHELSVAQLVDSHHRHVERFIPIGSPRFQPPTCDHVVARVDEGRIQLPFVPGLQSCPGPHPACGMPSQAIQATVFAAVRERIRFADHDLGMAHCEVGFQVAFFDPQEEAADGLDVSCDITPPFLSVPVQRQATFSTPPGASDEPPPQSSNSGPFFVEHHPLELPELDPVRNRPECCVAQPTQNGVLELAYAP